MPSIFEDLEATLASGPPAAAVDRLERELRQREDYHGLFYALILRERLRLGLDPVQTGRSEDLPAAVQGPYEEAIRQAARAVGRLYLDRGDIPGAWPFYRMIGEPEPVRAALEAAEPDDAGVVQQLVEIALHEGVHPTKGFDLVLKHFGLCSAITTLGQQFQMPEAVQQHCVRRLVRALYDELRERVAADVARREAEPPAGAGLRELIAGRDWLFADEAYHIDLSHLGAVAQFSIHLPPGPELELARELCAYGRRLAPKLRGTGEPPFEDSYRDYEAFLAALAGDDVEGNVAHFRAKAEAADPQEVGTFPAEVLVILLSRVGRAQEAVAAYARYLAQADARQLRCPSLQELCAKAGDFRPLVEVSLRRGDLVNYAAGLLQCQLRHGQPRPSPG